MKEFLESKAGTTLILFAGLLAFSAAVVVCAVTVPANERIYTFLTGIASGFSGSLFTYLQIHKSSNP